MRGKRPVQPGRVAVRAAIDAAATTLLRNSLVAYLVVEVLHKVWALLNADIVQIIKRVH